MRALLDSSVLVAALAPDEDRHAECLAILLGCGNAVYAHAFLEAFSTLTGGKLGVKVDADLAAKLLSETVLPRVDVIELSSSEHLSALSQARKQGVRGGGVYDYMHVIAARKAHVDTIYTLNLSDFLHLRRQGDPELLRP
jgi:predicted nucleic acid-binding protein